MKQPIRIANCSGFYGDRQSAALEMVSDGPIDVLTGDWLAELTMLILARTKNRPGGGGYAHTFLAMLEQVMGTCLDKGIKIVSNAGGLDPSGCAQAVTQLADKLGLSPQIGYVEGDNLIDRVDQLTEAGVLTSEGSLTDPILTANAYLGGWGITAALQAGADIVVTGRVTDAAVVSGPAAAHFGWEIDQWDELAGAVVAGHIIECSAQATGGNYSFFTEIPGYNHSHSARLGFPWAEISADGTAVIGKHAGTGGVVNRETVTSQLLYEIGSPQYLGPDVTSHFDTITLTELGPDRVGVSGVRGSPPPGTLKVVINRLGGYRNGFEVALTGLDIEAKAEFIQAAFWAICPHDPSDFDRVRSDLIRSDRPDPDTNEAATAIWRVVAKDADRDKVGRSFTNAIVQTALASIPGMYLASGAPTPAAPFGVMSVASIPAELVPAYVYVGDTDRVQVPSTPGLDRSSTPTDDVSFSSASATPVETKSNPTDWGPTRMAPLGLVVGARSGDKGGNANLGLFTRSETAFRWLSEFMDVETLKQLLPETKPLAMERYDFPNLWALNFLIYGLLEEGVAACSRMDPQAKSLGEWVRARLVPLPVTLTEDPPHL